MLQPINSKHLTPYWEVIMCDLPAAFRQITRTARKKTHKCCECRCEINPGDNYVYSSGIWDGEPQGFKQCVICAEVSSAAADLAEYPDEGPGFSALREWFLDHSCQSFHGEELIQTFARDMNIDEAKIRHVLGN